MFVEIPPHVSVSDFVCRAKGQSSRKIQQEFEHIRKRYRGQRFWQRGYFSTTSATSPMTPSLVTSTGMATKTASGPPPDPADVSRSGIQIFWL